MNTWQLGCLSENYPMRGELCLGGEICVKSGRLRLTAGSFPILLILLSSNGITITLIKKYKRAVLWRAINSPAACRALQLFALED